MCLMILAFTEMTSDDTDDLLEAVVVCEGNIKDPKFINQFPNIVKRLKCIICEGALDFFLYSKFFPF